MICMPICVQEFDYFHGCHGNLVDDAICIAWLAPTPSPGLLLITLLLCLVDKSISVTSTVA